MYLNTILAPPSARYSQSLGLSIILIDFCRDGHRVRMSFRVLLNRNYYFCRHVITRKLFGTEAISKNSKSLNVKISGDDEPSNISKTWSQKQIPKSLALQSARFETVDISKQPNPAPAIKLISKVPINQVHENIVACDGGGGRLGHPKIYINLVKPLFSVFTTNFLFRIKIKQYHVLIVAYAIKRFNKNILLFNSNQMIK